MDQSTRMLTAVCDDALGASDTVDLIARLHRREVSPEELWTAARERISRANPTLNAVVVDLDGLPEDAPVADAPFSGIPTAIKDTEDIAGYPTCWGSNALADRPVRHTSPIVAQWLALGFRPLVKTAMPEFGLTATTESVRYGPTRNPWDTARSTGGSSGGSAALVAAGALPLAHANDGGGSTRIPAACCGLVGLKPSRGRLIDAPELAQAPVNIVVQGVLTRTVRDTALYYAEAEKLYRNPSLPPIGHVQHPGSRRLRIAVTHNGYRGVQFSPATESALLEAGRLCEALGHNVDVIDFPYEERFASDFLRYWMLVAFSFKRLGRRIYGSRFDGSRTEPFTNALAGMLNQHLERIPGALVRLRRDARRDMPLHDHYDVLIGPVVGHEAPPIGWLGADVPFRTHLSRLVRYAMATPMQNITGAPGISLPLGRTMDGAPVGVHFGAAIGQERLLLELAHELEAAAPWPLTPPGP